MKNKSLVVRSLPILGVFLVGITLRVHAQEFATMLEDSEADKGVFLVDEQMPRLIGGTEAMSKMLRYPRMAELAHMHGKITIEFTVDEEGDVTDVHPLKPVKWLGLDVLAVIETLQFEPARQNGRPVPVKMHLPLTFIIDGLTD